MEIKPIRTEDDYDAALEEIERLFDSEPNTPAGDKLDVLVTLVEVYEAQHYPIPKPDPIEAIEYHMERLGLTRKDLELYIGLPSRVSEILNRKRPLTLRMIRGLSKGLGMSIEILVQPYETALLETDMDADFLSVNIGLPILEFFSASKSEEKFLRKESQGYRPDFAQQPDYQLSKSGTISVPIGKLPDSISSNTMERIM